MTNDQYDQKSPSVPASRNGRRRASSREAAPKTKGKSERALSGREVGRLVSEWSLYPVEKLTKVIENKRSSAEQLEAAQQLLEARGVVVDTTTAQRRLAELEAIFASLTPQEQAKFLSGDSVRDGERALAGQVLHKSRKDFYDPKDERNGSVGMATAIAHIGDTLARMKCADPIEEMLVTQMVWAHSRVARATELANVQTNLAWFKTMTEAADAAHNTSRRLALALAEYRRPTKQFIARQLNQLIQNGAAPAQPAANKSDFQDENATNEKALPHQPAETLPPFIDGVGFVTGEHRERETVAADTRPGDGGGQGAVQPQRMEARRAECGGHAPAA